MGLSVYAESANSAEPPFPRTNTCSKAGRLIVMHRQYAQRRTASMNSCTTFPVTFAMQQCCKIHSAVQCYTLCQDISRMQLSAARWWQRSPGCVADRLCSDSCRSVVEGLHALCVSAVERLPMCSNSAPAHRRHGHAATHLAPRHASMCRQPRFCIYVARVVNMRMPMAASKMKRPAALQPRSRPR